MSKRSKISRRIFVGTAVAGAVTTAVIARPAWWPFVAKRSGSSSEPVTTAAAMAILLRAIGPWTREDQEVRLDFTNRFLSPERMTEFESQKDVVLSTAKKFSDDDVALKNLQMSSYSEDERQFAQTLCQNLYGKDEVRAYLRKYPPRGSCVGDLVRHTKTPT